MQCTGSAPVQVLPCRSQVLERLQAIFEAFGAVVTWCHQSLGVATGWFDRGQLCDLGLPAVFACVPAEWQRYQGMSRETRIVCIWAFSRRRVEARRCHCH